MRKLLIADGSEHFRDALADAMRGAYIVRTAWEGNQALELLGSFKPDVLVLDLMMPGLDGITLLERIREMGLRPVVLATTRFASDYVLERLAQMGVGFVMVKPCEVKAAAARIADLTQRMDPPEICQPDQKTAVCNLLLTLGIPTKLRGYPYLREAILLEMGNPGQSVTKELYPAVASACNASAAQVERSIRSAIQTAWMNRDEQIWRLYFQSGPTGTVPRPTNGGFISRLADRLLMSREMQGSL